MIYRVECKDCDGAYVGKTCRTVNERVKEHKAHTLYNRVDLSAIAEHAVMSGHQIDWEHPQVLDQEAKTVCRRVKEALFIRREKTILNKDKGLELSPLWLSVI